MSGGGQSCTDWAPTVSQEWGLKALGSCIRCGLVSSDRFPPVVPGMLSWCLGASRGWKLEWRLTPT